MFARDVGALLWLFAGAYGTAFLTVELLRRRPVQAVPIIIVISLTAAIFLIYVVSRRAGGFAQFGFQFCHYRYIAAAIVLVVPIGWAVTILVSHLTSGPPPPETSFRPVLMCLYFFF